MTLDARGPDPHPARPAPDLRDLVRAAAASPDAFDLLARQLMTAGAALTEDDLEALLPEVDLLIDRTASRDEPALTVSETGAILSANPAAVALFALSGGRNGMAALGVDPAEFGRLTARLDRHPSGASLLLTRPPGADDPLLMSVRRAPQGSGLLHLHPLAALWPEALDAVLVDLYGLSPRELQVLRGLHAGQSAEAIAAGDGRALGTVRQQIKSILSKLGLRSQGQMQTFLAAAAAALRAEREPAPRPQAAPALTGLIADPGNPRQPIGMIEFGDLGGVPCLMLHGALYGLGAHPGERMAAQVLGLRVLGPERAGYGRSAPPLGSRGGADPAELRAAAARAALACLDARGIDRAVVVAQDTGLVSALALAVLAPARVAAIVAASATPPLASWEDSAGMPPQQRIFALCMLRAPALADSMVNLGLARMRRLGSSAWPEAVFGGVPLDVAVAREPQNLAAVNAAYAYNTTQAAAGFRLDMADLYRDWGDLPGRVACPVVFLHGAQNRTVAPERVRRFAATLPQASVEVIEDAGHTLALSHHALILRRALQLAWAAGLA